MKPSENIITADGHAQALHIATEEEAAACAHVRHVEGELFVERAHFVAPGLSHVGMVRVGWGAQAELPACRTVATNLQVWGDGKLDIACVVVAGGVHCGGTAQVRMPECKTIGQHHARSLRLVQSSAVDAPKLQRVDGGIDVIDQASLKAPYIAMAHARAALVAAQKLIEKAAETGSLTANGPNRPVKLSARLMQAGLEAMPAAAPAPSKSAPKASALEAVDPLAGAQARPSRRARP